MIDKFLSYHTPLIKLCNYLLYHFQILSSVYFGIPEFLDSGRLTLDAGHYLLDSGRWILDAGLWMLDSEPWTLHARIYTLDSGRWMIGSGRQNFKIENCPKLWKHWTYISNFIYEFCIDKNLWLFQEWKFIYDLLISDHSF